MSSGQDNGDVRGGDGSCMSDADCEILGVKSGDAMVCKDTKCVFKATAHADAGSMDEGEHGGMDSGLVSSGDNNGDNAVHNDFRRMLKSKLGSGGKATGSSCSTADNATCDRCVIGYFGDNTSACTKCDVIHGCAHPRGHKLGPSCDGTLQSLKCGECKHGFSGDLCEPCAEHTGCAKHHSRCHASVSTGSVCDKCQNGYFMVPLANPPLIWAQESFGECSVCDSIPNCLHTKCTGTGGSTCRMCEPNFQSMGATCAPLMFDKLANVWTAQM